VVPSAWSSAGASAVVRRPVGVVVRFGAVGVVVLGGAVGVVWHQRRRRWFSDEASSAGSGMDRPRR
jgi:hypothetical protein